MQEQNLKPRDQEYLAKYPQIDSFFSFGEELVYRLSELKLDLNHLFIIHTLYFSSRFTLPEYASDKWNACLQYLARNQYVGNSGSLTLKGAELYESFFTYLKTGNFPNREVIEEIDQFEEWWKIYPVSDGFKKGDKKFGISRSLKIYGKKADHKKKLEAIINEGQHTWQNLIEALETEILHRKDESCRSGDNKLKYMHNSLTYIIQRDFEAWVEENKKPKEQQGFINELIDPKSLF